jgi:DNA-binding NarL/FixJ family response regulator
VPSSAEPSTAGSSTAEREAQARTAARRRQAVTSLQIGEATCRYAAAQLGGGIVGPAEAAATARFTAGELEVIAAVLRELAQPDDPAGRRALAAELAASGMSQREIAERVGVRESTVRAYLRR